MSVKTMRVQTHQTWQAARRWMQALLIGLYGLCGMGSVAMSAEPVSTTTQHTMLQAVVAKRACADLQATDLTDIGGAGSRITASTSATQNGTSVCAVEGTLAPSIGFKVLLPTQTWTQRYLQVGCGGLCGRIGLESGAADGCAPLNAGEFVTASTDMGHQGQSADFGLDAQKRADFAHRGVHLTALAAKKLIKLYYGQDAAYAYFNGCSDGGREALIEAQRYPEDFNGIIAGAPALNFLVQNTLYHGWQARSNTDPDGKAILVAAHMPLLHKAVLAQCDGLDGQVDGLIADPRACHFDPAVLQCPADAKAGDTTCLSTQEVMAARRLYDGPRDPATGKRLTISGPQPGSELAWVGVFIPRTKDGSAMSAMVSQQVLGSLAFEDPAWTGTQLKDLRFDANTFKQLQARHALFDATNPDLTPFAAAGHKLILWHGWSDPHISPLNTIAYHEAVQAQMGAQRTHTFERLYLLPGVYHCGDGEGPSAIDLLTSMMNWVERGVAPGAIQANAPSPKKRPSGFGQPTGMGGKGPDGPMGSGKPEGMGPGGMPPGAPPTMASGPAPQPRVIQPYPADAPVSTPDWIGTDAWFKPYAPRAR